MTKVVIVTGSNGFVGKCMQKYVQCNFDNDEFDFVFLNKSQCDLVNTKETCKVFSAIKPWGVIHLASMVGGLFENMTKSYDFMFTNTMINANVVNACHVNRVERLICVLSTCIFPDGFDNLHFSDLHRGEPHESNFGYAYSKRMLEVMVRAHNVQYGTKWQCIVPANLYGPYDHFLSSKSHVVPALIHKFHEAKKYKAETVVLRGSGLAKRQFVYVMDLVEIVCDLIQDDTKAGQNMIVSGDKEISIRELARYIKQAVGYMGEIEFESSVPCENDGQMSKTAQDSSNFSDWTPLPLGLRATYKSFCTLTHQF
ncbi:putative GDP-L-fucose synthetase [Catenaria anguillulae PL171]|uniref:Putative GDP-L-fucose synthetase n=1 Tax=Catenaria anguillulae PL171 TaxID=765915 RepID=A0A1Y2H5U3_9FUNG|nr:putative GDP-L-fucose synthetase [Catenaria anguillulae PL171]